MNYAQVSPRHFEATACGAAQILYEGEYSGIFKPHRHFMPLKRDLSNMAEVLDFARDDRRIKEFADCAYEEIIVDPANHYEHYVKTFDDAVEQRIEHKDVGLDSFKEPTRGARQSPKGAHADGAPAEC